MTSKWHSALPDNFRYEPNDKLDFSESYRQRKMLVMVRRLFPDYQIAHVPNGGKRGKMQAARLKADGVLAGWPDLTIAGPDRWAAFIEVKDATGVCSDTQKEVLASLANDGHCCGVFRTDRALHDFMVDMGARPRQKWPHDFMEREF